MISVIGLDPGISQQHPGGYADITDGEVVLRAFDTFSLLDMRERMNYLFAYADRVDSWVELVTRPGKLRHHAGLLEGVAVGIGIKCQRVTPVKWQGALSLRKPKSYSTPQHKNRLRAAAQQLYPHLADRITLATADALLIAEYGWQLLQAEQRLIGSTV